MLQDWRGNIYTDGEPLGPAICEHPSCHEPAVRNSCNAEGDEGRTHWHGEVHPLGGGPSRKLCAHHGAELRSENAAKATRRGIS